ncbi:MAG: RluA family pseudouridine synthase [Thermodesulfobacteriota bacterium]
MVDPNKAAVVRTLIIKSGLANQGQRLDSFLAAELTGDSLSRSRIKELLASGNIKVNGNIAKPAYRIRLNDEFEVNIPPLLPVDLTPEKVEFTILYEDDDLIVISKPPGLVVHPACGHQTGTLVHGLLFHCDNLSGISGVERPGIVHRLDMDTSGVMVVAKNDKSHQSLVAQFKKREVEKIYRAVIDGVPKQKEGRITLPIGRHQTNRLKMAINEKRGKPAITNYQLLELLPDNMSYIEVRLETGRTHQIRVHMAALGCPIAGDAVYGKKNRTLYDGLAISRQCLHSYFLGFTHPRSGQRMNFTAPLWPDIANTLDLLRGH